MTDIGYDNIQTRFPVNLGKASLFYPRNPLLAPPHMMADIRNSIVNEGTLCRRGGSAHLDQFVSMFASGNGGFEEGDFTGWTANYSLLNSTYVDETCDSFTGYSTSGSGTIEVSPAGQFHLYATLGDTARIYKDFGTFQNVYSVETRFKMDQIPDGSYGTTVGFRIITVVSKQLEVMINSYGVYIRDDSAGGYILVPGSASLVDTAWHTWKFNIHTSGTKVDIYRDGVLIASDVACDRVAGGTNGTVDLAAISGSFDAKYTSEVHIDWINVTEPVRTGSYSCKLDTSDGSTGAKSDVYLVDSNVLYEINVYYFVTSYTSGNAKLKIHFYDDAAGTSLISSSDVFDASATTTGWVDGSSSVGPGGTLSFPSGTLSVRLQQVWENTPSGIFFIDDVNIPSNINRITGLKQYRLRNGRDYLLRAYADGSLNSGPATQIKSGLDYLGNQCLSQYDFSGSSDWTFGSLWTISGGKATFSGLGISGLSQLLDDMLILLEPGKEYEFTYTISNKTVTGGTLSAQMIGSYCSSAWIDLDITNGTHTIRFTVASSPIGFSMQGASTDAGNSFEIDNVYIKEVIAYPVDINIFDELAVFTNSRNMPQVWNGSDAETRPLSGLISDDIKFNADTGSIKFYANPTAASDTLTIHGTTYSFVAGAPGAQEIQVAGSLALTLDNIIAVLSGGSEPDNVKKCTYTENGVDTLTVTRDTKQDKDPFLIEADITGGCYISGLTQAATIYFSVNPSADDTLVINGVTFTFKADPTDETTQILLGATLVDTLDNIKENLSNADKGKSHDELILATFTEDDANTLTITPLSYDTGILYPVGTQLATAKSNVEGVVLYASIETLGDVDFVVGNFEDGQTIQVSGSSTSDGSYTVAGDPSTTVIVLASGDSMTAEAEGDTVTITYGLHTDWYDGNYPKYGIVHGVSNSSSLWLFGCPDNPYMVYKAFPDTENFSSGYLWWAKIDTKDLYGIVGAVEYGKRLFFFGKDQTYYIDDVSTSSDDWRYYNTNWKGGAAHHKVIVKVDNDVHIMAKTGTIYSMQAVQAYGDYKAASLTVEHWIDRWMTENVDFTYIDQFRAEYDETPGRKAVYWSVVRKGQTQADTTLVYFVDTKTWQIHDNRDYASGYNVSEMTIYEETDGSFTLITGDHNGQTWRLNQAGLNDNGNGYYWGFTQHRQNYGDASMRMTFDYLHIVQDVLGSHSINIRVWVDDSELTLESSTFDVDNAYKIIEIGQDGNDCKVEFYNSNANEPVGLHQMTMYIDPSGVDVG